MNDKYILPTYEECVKIATHSNNAIFYEIRNIVNGYNVSIFNYNICYKGLFDNPIPGSDLKGHELRGLMFVFNDDGSLYKRILLLRKFFNVGQENDTDTDIDNIRLDGISDVYDKADGSVLSFVKFPNGDVLARSKCSFITQQASAGNAIYNTRPEIKTFVNYCLDNDLIPIFEYVAPTNRIVLQYDKPDLILIRVRDNNTGEYVDLGKFDEFTSKITMPNKFKFNNIDEIINESKTASGVEGWVFSSNNRLFKIKTEWYLKYHTLHTDVINRINLLIHSIIDGEIDDIIPQIDEDRKLYIDGVTHVINSVISDIHKRAMKLIDDEYTGDIRLFAINNKNNELFKYSILYINTGDMYPLIIKNIKKETLHLFNADKWLKDNMERFGTK